MQTDGERSTAPCPRPASCYNTHARGALPTHLQRLAGLPDLQLLPDARDHVEASVQRRLMQCNAMQPQSDDDDGKYTTRLSPNPLAENSRHAVLQ